MHIILHQHTQYDVQDVPNKIYAVNEGNKMLNPLESTPLEKGSYAFGC